MSAPGIREILKKSTNVGFALWLGFYCRYRRHQLEGEIENKTRGITKQGKARRIGQSTAAAWRGGSPLLPYKKISSLKARH